MTTVKGRLIIGSFGALVFLQGIGCQSLQPKEELLTQAGFRSIKHLSPQQASLIVKLPQGHITSIVKNGKTIFLFPDSTHHLLLVGNQAEYQTYQQLRLKKNISRDAMATKSLNVDAASDWSDWGGLEAPYWGPDFNNPTP
jgi:hypothetical protein